jgi:hypothetical protein
MSIDIEKHIETLKKEAVKYWGESEQNGLIQRTLQALEQLQKEIGELKRDKTDLLEQIKDANCLGEVSKILRQYGVN